MPPFLLLMLVIVFELDSKFRGRCDRFRFYVGILLEEFFFILF